MQPLFQPKKRATGQDRARARRVTSGGSVVRHSQLDLAGNDSLAGVPESAPAPRRVPSALPVEAVEIVPPAARRLAGKNAAMVAAYKLPPPAATPTGPAASEEAARQRLASVMDDFERERWLFD